MYESGARLVTVLLVLVALGGCRPGAKVPATEVSSGTERTEPVESGDRVQPATEPNKVVKVADPSTDDRSNDQSPDDPSPVIGGNTKPVAVADVPKVRIEQPLHSPAGEEPVQIISFDNLNIGMQVDARFRPQMLEFDGGLVKELFGKRINVAGYMYPTDTLKGVTEFVLLKNLECKFGPGGQADHLVRVVMAEGLTTEFTDRPIYVEGILSLNPYPDDEPITWSIYDLKATKISTRPPRRTR